MTRNYKVSESILEKAKKSIPLGSQTFSKSITQFPYGVSPYFAKKGKGAIIWDVDNNEYIDFINSLLSVSIGYADEDINNAVKSQIDMGVTFSLSHPLELEVADKLIDLVPCAEMVRFGKNGSDSTSAAIRLARAFTKKDIVLVCGYHGWQDWYIGSTSRSLGVPESIQKLTKVFQYNSFDSFNTLINEYSGRIAAVIMEPMNTTFPKKGFLEHIRVVTKKEDIVLIFDETITGCRFAKGGAQELFGVTPDLATFGKGIGNGYPLSAVMGQKDIMSLMEDIFYSGTFAGETASLAAANVVLDKIKYDGVCDKLESLGQYLMKNVNVLILQHKLENVIECIGHPSWSFLTFKDTDDLTALSIKTYFMQEMFERGILTFGTHNLSFSHTKEHVDILLSAYDEFFSLLTLAIENNDIQELLNCDVLVPLFKVR